MKYKILQLKDIKNSDYAFKSWQFAKDKFNIKDYKQVYKGNIKLEKSNQNICPENYLEHLFYIFNMEHPVDFYGHSLSVGDVVKLDSVFYYCDSFGWSKIK